MKVKLIVIGFILSILCIYVVISVLNGYSKYKDDKIHSPISAVKSTYSLSKEDSELIKKSEWAKITVHEVYNSKLRNSILQLTYNERYNLLIYKINLDNKLNHWKIGDLLKIELKDIGPTIGANYRIIGTDYFNFWFHGGKIKPASKVYISLGGESIIQASSSDSLLSYHFVCNNFSLKYGLHDKIDIFYEAKQNFEAVDFAPIAMNLTFYIRDNSLYFFCMSPINPKDSTDRNALYDLLQK